MLRHRGGRFRSAWDDPPRSTDKQVVDHTHGGEIERVLMKHADPVSDGVGGRSDRDPHAVEQDPTAVGCLETREYLHEGTLAGPVFAEDTLDGARRDGKADPVIGFDRPEVLSDVYELDFHRSLYCRLREEEGETAWVSPSTIQPCTIDAGNYSDTLWPSIP
jgi:hypothetical protein